MNLRCALIVFSTFAATTSAPTQPVAPTAGSAEPGAASIPDISRVWAHPSLPWFEPPASGPGPVTNRSRGPQRPSGLSGSQASPALKEGVSNYDQLVGDYANPILKPQAADIVKKHGDLSLNGVTYGNPANQCWPEPVPFLFKHMAMQMLQLPDEIVMLFNEDHEVRRVKLNQQHPAHVTRSEERRVGKEC